MEIRRAVRATCIAWINLPAHTAILLRNIRAISVPRLNESRCSACNRPGPAALIENWKRRSKLLLQETVNNGSHLRFFGLQRSNGGGELRLVIEDAVHCRLLRADRLLLCGDRLGEFHLRRFKQLHLRIKCRLLGCGGATELLRLRTVLTHLLLNRGEARRVATNAICERDVSLPERREAGKVNQKVGEALA